MQKVTIYVPNFVIFLQVTAHGAEFCVLDETGSGILNTLSPIVPDLNTLDCSGMKLINGLRALHAAENPENETYKNNSI